MNIEDVHREWLKTIRAAMTEQGAIPGIVPTGGWGFAWGNGPAWDCVLFWLPYYAYQYRGDLQIVKDNADAMLKYLQYMAGKRREDGLISYGLGDWCQTLIYNSGAFETPLEITDSLIGYDLCQKSVPLFKAIGWTDQAEYAQRLGEEFADAFKKKWINGGSVENASAVEYINTTDEKNGQGHPVKDKTQTAQALALALGLFDDEKKDLAVRELVCRIERDGNHFNVGVVGGYSLFPLALLPNNNVDILSPYCLSALCNMDTHALSLVVCYGFYLPSAQSRILQTS